MEWRIVICLLMLSFGNASKSKKVPDDDDDDKNKPYDLEGYPRDALDAIKEVLSSHPGCGGDVETLRSAGEITTPNFPMTYANNTLCKWEIIAPIGKIIRLKFQAFNVERETFCRFDQLKIYDGSEESGPLIANLCGHEIPSIIYSSARNMFLLFKTDGSVVHTGFKIRFLFGVARSDNNCSLGAVTIVRPGYITTPNFPLNYPNSAFCRWKIMAPPGYIVSLLFHAFNLEHGILCPYDSLRIYNGPTPNANGELVNLCGSGLPANRSSTGQYLYLMFISDTDVVHTGFMIQVYFGNTLIDYACGDHAMELTSPGQITSPNFPWNTAVPISCIWTITALPGHIISLNIEGFPNIAGSCLTYLDISEGGTSQNVKLCDSLNVTHLLSAGRYLRLKYKNFINDFNFIFKIKFSFLTNECGAKITSAPQRILSPSSPDSYPNNAICDWRITAPKGQIIKLTSETSKPFHLENSVDCLHDYLAVYRQHYSQIDIIGRYCGRSFPESGILTSSKHMIVVFHSDNYVSGSGFELLVEFIVPCGGILRGNAGQIASPFQDFPYLRDAACTWIIEVTGGKIIKLEFDVFNIYGGRPCNYRRINIYDGHNSTAPWLATLCGIIIPGVIKSTGSDLMIQYENNNGHGQFAATYTAIVNKNGPGEISACTALQPEFLADGEGMILSPKQNSSADYPENVFCQWRVMVPTGKRVHFHVNTFVLESDSACQYDHLDIFDGPSMHYSSVGSYCGKSIPRDIIVTVNDTLVQFTSDSSITATGFNITYSTTESWANDTIHTL